MQAFSLYVDVFALICYIVNCQLIIVWWAKGGQEERDRMSASSLPAMAKSNRGHRLILSRASNVSVKCSWHH